LPEPDCSVSASLGKEIQRRFGKPIATTRGSGRLLVLQMTRPTRIDTVVLQERIASGERVRAYRVEGQTEAGGSWKVLAQGSAIGHKRIQPVPPQSVMAVRLVVTEATAAPVIRTLALFDTRVAPPLDWDAPSTMWSPDLVGEWTSGTFTVDLSKMIHVAAQYALRFRPTNGAVGGFEGATLTLSGVSMPALIKAARDSRDELLLDITGLDASIIVSGRVLGAKSGSILLERR
jgi:alpha-L-fucosidase